MQIHTDLTDALIDTITDALEAEELGARRWAPRGDDSMCRIYVSRQLARGRQDMGYIEIASGDVTVAMNRRAAFVTGLVEACIDAVTPEDNDNDDSTDTGDETMTTYECTDGFGEVTIEAETAEDAAQAYVDGGDWGDNDHTIWVTVYVTPEGDDDDREEYKIAVDPIAPDCEKSDHEWIAPHSVVGGHPANPGVFGHAGGAKIHEVCEHCNVRRITDTWAQDPSDGVQGLTSITYQ